MQIEFRRLSKIEFITLAPRLVEIYLRAMHYDPDLLETRVTAWRQHTQLPGFAAIIAITDNREIVGIAYGHSGTPLNWWHTQIQRGLHSANSYTPENRRTLSNYFELSEIHVDPEAQGVGIGRQLLLRLAETTRHPSILLSTPEVPAENNAAFGLYRRLGFTDLLRHHVFSGDAREFAILQATLPFPHVESATEHVDKR
ncbi:GNAT family N-acetyltransferase [Corynebacterium epidermidicanis]|uniref:Acetyltransferase (GNAT) family protein n=1 Tax=Corynebacterium epidermidicanis TaxID=1050174 RepID=A0A0G3GVF5_9CORY|nr:N-acetyltransferase [Corynebacterium epidermidicanis]AKK03533.1 acetyltransferase (GNAT) family protein [Corynebacterium epidermidicanis]